MRTQKYLIRVISTGLVTLVLLSISLFIIRKACQSIFYEGVISYDMRKTKNNSTTNFTIKMTSKAIDGTHGEAQEKSNHFSHWPIHNFPPHFHAKYLKGKEVIWSIYEKDKNRFEMIYFDKPLGQFIFCEIVKDLNSMQAKWAKNILGVAGPEGITKVFNSSNQSFGEYLLPTEGGNPKSFAIYDQYHRRFFNINFSDAVVKKGPEFISEGSRDPVQIGYVELNKNPKAIKNEWSNIDVKPGIGMAKNKMLVLDQSGRIDYLDLDKLDYSTTAGTLLADKDHLNLFGNKVDDFSAYRVTQFVDENKLSRGVTVAVLPRHLFFMVVHEFDKTGINISSHTQEVIFDKSVGGLLYMAGRFFLENLQPPALSVASFATAEKFDATQGEQALFLLSNSFVAILARIRGDSTIMIRSLILLLMISPSLLLGGFLAWRVVRDAKAVGLTRQTRRNWLIATILLGLTAYFTYRITRPQATLVTCKNCGKPRRPDHHLCHHCQSQWHQPELNPPQWNVRTA